MASNLKYLEDKLLESKHLALQYKTSANAEGANVVSLNKALTDEKFYYSSLAPINIKKRKASEAKQALLKTQIATAKDHVNYWLAKVNSQNAVTADIQSKINSFLDAVNEGTSAGLKGDDALEFANQAVNAEVAEMQANEQAQADSNNAKAQSKLVNYILIGLAVAIVIGLIYYFMKKNKKK